MAAAVPGLPGLRLSTEDEDKTDVFLQMSRLRVALRTDRVQVILNGFWALPSDPR